MQERSFIKFNNQLFDLSMLKEGLQKSDYAKANTEKVTILFDFYDKKNKDGLKNGVLDSKELQILVDDLLEFSNNGKLSKKEARHLLDSLGFNDISIEDLYNFLKTSISVSETIQSVEYDKNNKSTIIEYKEGFYDEVLDDGTHKIKAKESVDTFLEKNLDLDVSFMYLGDYSRNMQLSRRLMDSLNNAKIESIIERNNLAKGNEKVCYDERNPEFKSKEIYYDENGNEAFVITYEINSVQNENGEYVDKNDVKKMEYLENGQWTIINYRPDFGSHSISIMNSDSTKILTESFYLDDKILALKTFDKNSNRSQEVQYDYQTNNINQIFDLDEKGQKIKNQKFDENGKLKSMEIRDYFPNGGISKIKEYDGNNNLLKITEIDANGEYQEYDSAGNLIIKDDSVNSRIFAISGGRSDSIKYLEYALDDSITNDFGSEEMKKLLEVVINRYKQNLDIFVDTIQDGHKELVKERMFQTLDKCLNSNNPTEVSEIIKLFRNDNIEYVRNVFLYDVYKDDFTGEIKEVTYQGFAEDCWLLSATNAISETESGGEDFIKNLFKVDKSGNIVVKLLGGKQDYIVTEEDLKNNANLSLGSKALRAIEIAFDRYFKEFKPNGDDSIDGGWGRVAFSILSGNEPINATRKEGVLGVMIDGEFVSIEEANVDKLKHIPIDIQDLTQEDLKVLATLKHRMAMTCNSLESKYAHAYYVKDINPNSVQVKEPHDTGTIATYSLDGFLKIYSYGAKSIFIL